MAESPIEDSPRPFRRERNLSNRNFNKRGSRHRMSTESHSSVDSSCASNSLSVSDRRDSRNRSQNHNPNQNQNQKQNGVRSSNSSGTSSVGSSGSLSISSAFQYSYSVNSDTENAFNLKSLRKIVPAPPALQTRASVFEEPAEPQTPEPALLGVKQKVLRFETLQTDERIIFKTGKHMSKSLQSVDNVAAATPTEIKVPLGPLRVLPVAPKRQKHLRQRSEPQHSEADPSLSAGTTTTTTSPSASKSLSELRSEDEVDDFSDFEDEAQAPPGVMTREYLVPEEGREARESVWLPEAVNPLISEQVNVNVPVLDVDDFNKVETVAPLARSISSVSSPSVQLVNPSSEQLADATGKKDFPRNFRSTPRPKTEIIDQNRQLISKYNSLQEQKRNTIAQSVEEEEEEEEIELRNKSGKLCERILDELIATEETYVENLLTGIKNYGNIFTRKDLPLGLRGKKYVLLGNIEQIAEFHRDHFLPMLHRERRDLKRLFDEFQIFIEQHSFYSYVIFTMNKQRSLKLCDTFKNYFKMIQMELGDKLGINSFLVQPIQRMARYPLLLQQFMNTLFKNSDFVMKSTIGSCCRLERRMRVLLTTTNESEIINDIVDCHEFNVFYQGRFRKVSEFQVYDYTLKRSYRSKVFIFDKCIIYTEVKGKSLVFHGRYPCEHVGIVAKAKTFTLFYERRRQQECDFNGDPVLVETWLELIRDMINSYANDERRKLQELHSHENDHWHRKPTNLSLFRDSNRFSSDSGIGNIWVLPKPEPEEGPARPTTTWYTTT